jgi:response regulator RpfG family c-di-GMP phosphodiesterase
MLQNFRTRAFFSTSYRSKFRSHPKKETCMYADLFPMIREKIALLDPSGRFRMVAPAFYSMLEISGSKALEGRRISDFLDNDTAIQFQSIIDLMKINGQSEEQVELEFISTSGQHIPTRVTLKSFNNDHVAYTYLDVEDLGKWKATQNELLETRFELELSYSAILAGWARTLELRDIETKGHCDRVANLMADLSLRMGFQLEETHTFRNGAIMHDIGKIGITDSILFKPGPLNDDEWLLMKQHPVIARELLSSIDFLKSSLAIPYSHHEKWDGSGYPEGLKGEAIPIEARMFAVIDVWDALTHVRPYRDVWPLTKALTYIQDYSGSIFDPTVVKVYVDLISYSMK